MKDDRLYLEHIREAIGKIVSYSACGPDELMRNTMVQDAIARNPEIIGQVTKRLSQQTRRRRPDIPYNDIARFRDVLIHHYMGVDPKRVCNVVETQLRALRDAVEELLNA